MNWKGFGIILIYFALKFTPLGIVADKNLDFQAKVDISIFEPENHAGSNSVSEEDSDSSEGRNPSIIRQENSPKSGDQPSLNTSFIDSLISTATNFYGIIKSYLRDGDDFSVEFLNAHNAYREKHGVPPLVLNDKISQYSSFWAKTLAYKGTFQHRPQTTYGENIFYARSSLPNFSVTGNVPVDSWYSEIKNYTYSRRPNLGTGHFSQIIWKDTKEVGVGLARTEDGKVYVVANYFPPGNIAGRYIDNVPGPIK